MTKCQQQWSVAPLLVFNSFAVRGWCLPDGHSLCQALRSQRLVVFRTETTDSYVRRRRSTVRCSVCQHGCSRVLTSVCCFRRHLFVQVELFLWLLAGYLLYLNRDSIRSVQTDTLLSGVLVPMLCALVCVLMRVCVAALLIALTVLIFAIFVFSALINIRKLVRHQVRRTDKEKAEDQAGLQRSSEPIGTSRHYARSRIRTMRKQEPLASITNPAHNEIEMQATTPAHDTDTDQDPEASAASVVRKSKLRELMRGDTDRLEAMKADR